MINKIQILKIKVSPITITIRNEIFCIWRGPSLDRNISKFYVLLFFLGDFYSLNIKDIFKKYFTKIRDVT